MMLDVTRNDDDLPPRNPSSPCDTSSYRERPGTEHPDSVLKEKNGCWAARTPEHALQRKTTSHTVTLTTEQG